MERERWVYGQTVKLLCERNRMSAHALAVAFGDGRREAGRHIVRRLRQQPGTQRRSAEEAALIAQALGVSVEDLERELLWVLTLGGESPMDLGGLLFAYRDLAHA